MKISGKLLVLGILGIALAAAGLSWWFRYHETHQAAQFWRPQATLLIRDAPLVEALRLQQQAHDSMSAGPPATEPAAAGPPPEAPPAAPVSPALEVDSETYAVAELRDVSHAPGMLHLRNALLESKSYVWGPPGDSAPPAGEAPLPVAKPPAGTIWSVGLRFSDADRQQSVTILFTDDFRWLHRLPGSGTPAADIQSAPIADKLATMFADLLPSQPPGR